MMTIIELANNGSRVGHKDLVNLRLVYVLLIRALALGNVAPEPPVYQRQVLERTLESILNPGGVDQGN